MAKASFKFTNGTDVVIEGSPEEVQKLLAFYGPAGSAPFERTQNTRAAERVSKSPAAKLNAPANDEAVDLVAIINHIKSCEQADLIEKNVLDKPSQLSRVVLPLGIVHEYMGNAHGLTSGEISKITTELGIPMSMANTSRTLAGLASKYVMGDKVRKTGQSVRYRLSRRGVEYFRSLTTLGTNN
jgi:hypothetical protein